MYIYVTTVFNDDASRSLEVNDFYFFLNLRIEELRPGYDVLIGDSVRSLGFAWKRPDITVEIQRDVQEYP